jgi:hypothetical protein
MIPVTKHICRALLIGALLFIPVSVGSATHVSKKPCWETVTDEWYAGKIKDTFPQSCYQQAIDHLPAPVLIYGTARQDIEAAAADAGFTVTGPSGPTTTTSTSTNPGDKSPPESFPVVLIVLGVIAVVLVVAGIAGVLWRRSHPDGTAEE